MQLSTKQRIGIIAGLSIVLVVLTLLAFVKVSQWYDAHEIIFRSPFQKPVQVVLRPQKADYVAEISATEKRAADLTTIVNNVYGLESTFGKHDDCSKQGKFNGYGFRENSSEHMCFATHAEVQSLVASWFNDRLESGLTLNEALCLYNSGKPDKACTYSNNYHLINN